MQWRAPAQAGVCRSITEGPLCRGTQTTHSDTPSHPIKLRAGFVLWAGEGEQSRRHAGDLPSIPQAATGGAGISSQLSQLLPSQAPATLSLSCLILLLSTQLSLLNRLLTEPVRQLSGLDECLHSMEWAGPPTLFLSVLLTLISH